MTPATIAVTGVAGLLAQRLLPHLDAMDDVVRIVGLDVAEPARRVRALEFHRVDIASSDLTPLLDGVEAIVHLAGVVERGADRTLLAHVNLEGTRRVLAAAATVGARRIVRASSAAVYGAWPNNPVPLTEDAPLRPNPGFLPALHDAENERRLGEWRESHPAATATTLRMAPVVGPGAHGLLARAALGRAPVSIRGVNRQIQVVHVDDAAGALALAVSSDLDGAYNVAADGWVADSDVRAIVGSWPPALPEELARRLLRTLWSSGLGEAPPELLPYLAAPWVVANDRLRAQGWVPRHTNESAIRDSLPLDGGDASPSRTARRTATAAAVVAGAAGTSFGVARAARRRRLRRARP